MFSDDVRSLTSGSDRIAHTDDVMGELPPSSSSAAAAANRSPRGKQGKLETSTSQLQLQLHSSLPLSSNNGSGHLSIEPQVSPDSISRYRDLSKSISSLGVSDPSLTLSRRSKSPKGSFDFLNDENYDTSVLKIGWLNRSHGEVLSIVPLSQIHGNSDTNTAATNSNDNDNGNGNGNSNGHDNVGGSNVERSEFSSSSQRDSRSFSADQALHLQRSVTIEGELIDHVDSRSSKAGTQSTISGSGGETSIMVPDYKMYKAQLKGCLLNLYKHDLGSGVKYFEPVEWNESKQQQQQQGPSGSQNYGGSANGGDSYNELQSGAGKVPLSNQKKRSTISGLGMISRIENSKSNSKFTPSVELKYLCADYPHPDLKLDKDGRIIGGTVESLCHAILFSPFKSTHEILSPSIGDGKAPENGSNSVKTKTQRHVADLVIILPLVNNFGKFLGVLNQIGLVFTSGDEKLSSTLPQYHHISKELDEQMTKRLGLVVRTINDVLPSFLLDENISQVIFSLLNTISLHDETTGGNLKALVTDRHNELLSLVSPLRSPEPDHSDAAVVTPLGGNITSITKFLSLDIDEFTNAVHSINLKYDKKWSPCLDYSLLYSSKYMKQYTLRYCPLVFNNKENLHYLGRLLITHLFPSDTPNPVSAKLRAKALTNWVQIGCKFERLGDMVSWLAIATVICSIPVLRLYSVWKHVSEITLKVIFREWIPTIIQLDRRQSSSRSTGSVFILAPPNLEDPFIRKNVISYFGDLVIYGDELPIDTKFKYLERKIHRTRNAFNKWQERLDSLGSSQKPEQPLHLTSTDEGQRENPEPKGELLDSIYNFWRYHISRPALNVKKIMELSLLHEPPLISPTPYIDSKSLKSPLSTGSYYPTIFNEPLPTYTIFPQRFLISDNEHPEVAPVSSVSGRTVSSRPSSSMSKKIPISEPIGVLSSRVTATNTAESRISSTEAAIDEQVAKLLSSTVPARNTSFKVIRDFFNIGRNDFKVSDDLILKSFSDPMIKSGVPSVYSTAVSSAHRSPVPNMESTQGSNPGGISPTALTKALEDMNFMDSIDKVNDKPNDTVIKVAVKYASLEKLFDLLVLPSEIFSRFVDPSDMEKYNLSKTSAAESADQPQSPMGILDYAFVKLVMEDDAFYETFFNTYKSFTSTLHVLENLGRRYVGAKSCAETIAKILDPSKSGDFDMNEDKFPVWDMKITKSSPSSLLHIAKIQTGATEALLYLVSNHYRDFTDDIKCNSTFLDILKIMEQEVTVEWPKIITQSQSDKTFPVEYLEEVKGAVLKLEEVYKFLKTNYHKQLYRPVGINKMQRRATGALETFNRLTYEDLLRLTSNEKLDDTLLSGFSKLHYSNYEDILRWVYQLNNLFSEYMRRVSKKQWYRTFEILDMTSVKSMTAFFNYPLHFESVALIDCNSFQLKELEVSNIFTFISTLTYKSGNVKETKRLIEQLPEPIQILLHLHHSLVSFFIVSVTNPAKEFRNRVETCAVLLQILKYCRRKNASLDLFEPSNDEKDNAISPHIPSFIETAISNAILSPECRYFELSWLSAHRLLSAPSANSPNSSEENHLKSIENILDSIPTIHLEKFAEAEESLPTKIEYFSICPGWFLCRLLEVSQCISNNSGGKHELIDFDKRRFVSGLVGLIHQASIKVTTSPLDRSGYLLFNYFQDPDKTFRKAVKGTATAEAKLMRFQETGLFNNILIDEIENCKRNGRKYDTLRVLEHNSRETLKLQQQFSGYKRDPHSHSTSKLHSNTVMLGPNFSGASVTSSQSSGSVNKMKRGSTVSLTNRSSVIGTSSTSGGSVSKKIGDFFRRPFSIAGFNVSGSNYPSSSSSPSPGYQQGQDAYSRKAIESTQLPVLEKGSIPDSKPSLTIKTFEIKSIVNILNFKNSPGYKFSFKLIMRDGREYVMQAVSAEELHEWVRMINISRRYSFHSKTFKSKTSNKVFGVPLEDICARENTTVPMIVTKLLDEIELRGLDEVGLYRVPGSIGSINALKNAFDVEGAVNNSFTLSDERWSEINVIAGCFKMYLRELPESLFSNDLVEEFSKLALRYRSLETGVDEYKEQMKKLLAELPVWNYQTMKRIVYHLNKVHQHEANNRMDASNLAIVFSMSFMDQEDLSSGMGPMLGGIQAVLQHFIRSPNEFFS